DASAWALLDFSGRQLALPDLTGKGHDGRIVGAKWVNNERRSPEKSAPPTKTPSADVRGTDRIPMPTADTSEKARAKVREMLPADFDGSPAALKLALARKFLGRAAEGEESAPLRYALLLEVREIAVQLLDLELAKE